MRKEKQQVLAKKLIAIEKPKELKKHLTEMYTAYIQSDFADCQHDRKKKTVTYLLLSDLLKATNN